MNPDTGDEAEDWFARFEREAREAAQQREAEPAAGPPVAPPPASEQPAAPPPANPAPPAANPAPPDPAPPQPAPPQPVVPLLGNPFDAPAATPVQPAAPTWEPEPTQAFTMPEPTQPAEVREPEPTQAMDARSWDLSTPEPEPTRALVPAPLVVPGAPEQPTDRGSALDSLFGDDQFREYESGLAPDPSNSPFAARPRSQDLVHVPATPGGEPPRTFGRLQKILAAVGGGLLAIIALIGLFLLGTRLPDLLGPAPAVSTAMPTPTPTLTALPLGPVEPGVYAWDELLGGECLEPYDAQVGAWDREYTVVDCSEPHGAQMVYRAWFPPAVVDPEAPAPVGKPTDPYPGAEALAAQISLLCSAPGVVDLAAAGAYSDATIQGSYPVDAEQWEADPSYYCFVSRSSGEPLTVSVAVPRTAPVS